LSGKNLGRLVIETLKEIAAAANCYKIILDCSASNVPFYQKLGFDFGHSPVCMALYF
jgi:glucosamine-phosphate N-acetyltransferase